MAPTAARAVVNGCRARPAAEAAVDGVGVVALVADGIRVGGVVAGVRVEDNAV